MEKNILQTFLISANSAGYASGNARAWAKENDGSSSISYIEGSITYHDNFIGGEPYGGRIVVSEFGKPQWIMVYYGWVVRDVVVDPVYQFLRRALNKMPEEMPLRGPQNFIEVDMEYTNKWSGDLERFQGIELIMTHGRKIYEDFYCGGWVDQRSGE